MTKRVPKVAINGFGRIGRLVLRALLEMDKEVDIIGINDIAPMESLAHLFEFDSVQGRFQGSVEIAEDKLIFNGDEFIVTSERDPENLPWKEWDVDIVIESTGKFRHREGMEKHLKAGAKKVILSAPGKTAEDVDVTLVKGVNDDRYDPNKHNLISNASCTTNCLATTLKVLDDNFGVEQGIMTTIHAFTNDQRILDSVHTDFRRMRTASMNMFPTKTDATKAIGIVMPHLEGKIDGLAVRIPTPNVSIVDLTARLSEKITVEQLREADNTAATGSLKDILEVEQRPLISIDFNHNPHSAIIDIPTMHVVDECMVKVLAWYDNEWGYVNRLAELVHDVFEQGV
jgi:glyceraldehyde 3-phosphate dehydrogenase